MSARCAAAIALTAGGSDERSTAQQRERAPPPQNASRGAPDGRCCPSARRRSESTCPSQPLKKPVYVGRALSGASSAAPIWSTRPLPSVGLKMAEITRGHQAFVNITAALLSSYPLPV